MTWSILTQGSVRERSALFKYHKSYRVETRGLDVFYVISQGKTKKLCGEFTKCFTSPKVKRKTLALVRATGEW